MVDPKQTLKRRIFTASAWAMVGHGLSQVIRFGSSLLTTRLLVPEMFGVMAIAVMVMIAVALFSDLGLRQNIIRSQRGSDPVFLNTGWTIHIIRGVVTWFLAIGISLLIVLANHVGMVPIESVYSEPILPYVIAVYSITAVIQGFESTKLSQAARELSLGRFTQIELVSQVVGLLCMLGWLAIDRSIWALAISGITSLLTKVILSHVWLPGVNNRLHWDKAAYREIIGFGKWIFVSSILGFLVANGDRLLLGALVSTTVMGIYVIAFLIFNSIESALEKVIADIAFPALSEVARERLADLKSRYYRFRIVITSLTYFGAGILMVSGQPLISLLYDQRYAQAGWMLEILATALLAVPFYLAPQCFMVLGMPRLLSNLAGIRLASLVLVTPIAFYLFGLAGALWGIVLSRFFNLPLIVYYKVTFGLFDLRKELMLLPAVLAGIAAGKAFNLATGF